MADQIQIKQVTTKAQMIESVKILCESFGTVAKTYHLTEMNCPTNPAYITYEKLSALQEKKVEMFGLYRQNKQIGFMAIERGNATCFYIEKLAILPLYRNRGYGQHLMNFAFDYIHKKGGHTISIGIIDKNKRLKNWYKNQRFYETDKKSFPHLPFRVCFMEKTLV